ncbi:INKA2 protein, partial [Copsychus sechellarum]|nr:INKA2 protein [Copsychus sechellarum]
LSMKEVGDGLTQQMNSMMGALQELKLLQLQTALEQLELSGHRNTGHTDRGHTGHTDTGHTARPEAGHAQGRCPVPWPARLSHATSDRAAASPSCSGQAPRPPGRAPAVSSRAEPGRTLQASGQSPARGWSLCQECPGCDDGHDWTSSLMSQSRTRQPLVLGDNVFADLVGNWLDLPELEKKGDKSEASLGSSRSQELCRKFSLTANIFKKFLRSVRPDRERLLKEKPCWLPPEDKQEISKRPKKISKLKGRFYLQGHGSRAERCPRAEPPRKVPDPRAFGQGGFDINTAVWV